jgi:uncharacterized membrane protein
MQKEDKPSKETLDLWHKDPSNWVWGMFYYNKKDKRIFPPKRISSLGWTVNFANPISVIALVIVLILILTIPRLIHNS